MLFPFLRCLTQFLPLSLKTDVACKFVKTTGKRRDVQILINASHSVGDLEWDITEYLKDLRS